MSSFLVANTAVSLVLHEYLAKYSTPEEAAKHTSEAFVSMQHFEEAVKKIRVQREMKPEEKTTLPQYAEFHGCYHAMPIRCRVSVFNVAVMFSVIGTGTERHTDMIICLKNAMASIKAP
jgi:hypothetical protein